MVDFLKRSRLKLRTKLLSLICLTLLGLLSGLYWISRNIVEGGFANVAEDLASGFSRIEVSDTVRNVRRVTDALGLQIEGLSLKAADWARWDDTYRFIRDRNAAYVKSNLPDDVFPALKINQLVLIDDAGRVVFGKAYDLAKERPVPLSESLIRELSPGSTLLDHDAPDSVKSGLLLLAEGPALIVSRPIVTSEGKGPIRGSVLFSRYLDDAEIATLARVTHLTVRVYRAGAADLPADVREASGRLLGPDAAFARPLDDSTVAGYAAVPDMAGRPALLVRVETPREIYQRGKATEAAIQKRGRVILVSLIASIIAAGLIFGAGIVTFLETSVLSRLTRLSTKAVEIGSKGDFSGRVETEGRDEIGTLADSVNRMLDALQGLHGILEARNAEVTLLMETVPAGLLSLDEEFRINSEHSRAAQQLLGPERLSGQPYVEALGLTGLRAAEGAQLLDFLQVFRDELIPDDAASELNPFRELQLGEGSGTRWIKTSYFNIRRGAGRTNHVLAVIEDATATKKLADAVTQQEKENARLRAVAEDPDLFREFLAETAGILGNLQDLVSRAGTAEDGPALVDRIFLGAHTIKGAAGGFGLHDLSAAASEFESVLARTKLADHLSQDYVQGMAASLARVQTEFRVAQESYRRLRGENGGVRAGAMLQIPLEVIQEKLAETHRPLPSVEADGPHDERSSLALWLRGLLNVPARRGLARSVKMVPGLIQRLGKMADFQFEGQETPIEWETAQELNSPLGHLLRNAFAHGLEPLEERIALGKPEIGSIRLEVERHNGHVVVALEDDGRGIDPEALRQAAVKRGILTPKEAARLSADEALDLIFEAGLSTAPGVTEASGRGVGMGSVRDSVHRRLGGQVTVSSQPGKGTRVTIRVPASASTPSC